MAALRGADRFRCNLVWHCLGGAAVTGGTYVMSAADWETFSHALLWIALFGGMAGGLVLSLLTQLYRWIEWRIDCRQRERDFRQDMAAIIEEIEAGRA